MFFMTRPKSGPKASEKEALILPEFLVPNRPTRHIFFFQKNLVSPTQKKNLVSYIHMRFMKQKRKKETGKFLIPRETGVCFPKKKTGVSKITVGTCTCPIAFPSIRVPRPATDSRQPIPPSRAPWRGVGGRLAGMQWQLARHTAISSKPT